MSSPYPQSDFDDIALSFWEGIDTPLALSCWILYKSGEMDQLVGKRCDPKSYLSSHSYYHDACAVEFLRKNSSIRTSHDKKGAAVKSFFESEHRCYSTNERLNPLLSDLNHFGPAVGAFLRSVRKKIRSTLGRIPDSLSGRFGPGATFYDRGRLTTVADKISSVPTLTQGCSPFLGMWNDTLWGRSNSSLTGKVKIVRGNRFTTVPKDPEKDRGICIEPSINVFYQLSVGSLIRDRLARVGIDLSHGQDLHRRLARESSLSGEFATIDLSSASDTVCYNLVKLLLPPLWFDLLDSLRSPFTQLENRWVKLEKFSSMGNGYTFELETLIFWALASSLGTDNVYVYGDDIIVPTDIASHSLSVLRFFGFVSNPKKTFLEGPFRESCGGDFFGGRDVRPFYLKETPNAPEKWIALANGLRRLGHYDLLGRSTHDFHRRAWLRSLSALPGPIRICRGPESLGDIVIHESDPRLWKSRWSNGVRFIRVYRPVKPLTVTWSHFQASVQLATALYGSVSDHPKGWSPGVTPRGSVTGHKLGWSAFS